MCGIRHQYLQLYEIQNRYLFRNVSAYAKANTIRCALYAYEVAGNYLPSVPDEPVSTSSSSSSSSSTSSSSSDSNPAASSSSTSAPAIDIATRAPMAELAAPSPDAAVPTTSSKSSRSKRRQRQSFIQVGVLMRYLERLTVYFLNPVKPMLFGNPLLLSLPESNLATMTVEQLLALAVQHLGPLLKLAVVEKDGVMQYPFKFRIVNRYLFSCTPRSLLELAC